MSSASLFPFNYWLNQSFDLMKNSGQLGIINISGNASNDPDIEREVIENVATYGRQLGRISEVLEALLRRADTAQWTGDEAHALEDFTSMVRDIEAVKNGRLPATTENVNSLIDSINALKDVDRVEYDRIVGHLRKRLLDRNGDANAEPRTRRLASKPPTRAKRNGA